MAKRTLRNLEKRIAAVRRRLAELGDMRPGTLSLQYRKPGTREQPFHQLSYTHKGRSRSEYVRAENLQAIRREVRAHKRFKALCEQLVELSIEASRLRCQIQKTSR